MNEPRMLSHKQAILLRCLYGGRKYGRQIRKEYEERVGKPISIGGLYETLADLEDWGYVDSEIGEETHERGGNRRKYFTVTGLGESAFDRFIATLFEPSKPKRRFGGLVEEDA